MKTLDRPCIFDFTPDSLQSWCAKQGLAGFVAGQIIDWVYAKGVVDPAAMTNLSRANRALLAEKMLFTTCDLTTEQLASDGTRKLLLTWHDGTPNDGSLPVLNAAARQTETVMIPTERRRTACVSSQVGCPVGCRFCASGLGGLDGNLRAGQIVEQVHRLGQLEDVGRISNVVFMGMGEPLANFSAVTQAIRTLTAPWGLGIGARRITVSTVGLPAAIRRLAEFEVPVTLALSLHAPDDALRRELIPWAEYAPIDELMDACGMYFSATGREITLEYLLLHRVNDQRHHAHALAEVAKQIRANVNLIRYNEVEGIPYERPRDDDVHGFQDVLRSQGVNVHIRASRGRDIAAACGQLRHEKSDADS